MTIKIFIETKYTLYILYYTIYSEMTTDSCIMGKPWPVFHKKYMKYVLISSNIPSILENPFIDEYTFWNSLPLLSNLKKCKFIEHLKLNWMCLPFNY